jgi:hypothetical protein
LGEADGKSLRRYMPNESMLPGAAGEYGMPRIFRRTAAQVLRPSAGHAVAKRLAAPCGDCFQVAGRSCGCEENMPARPAQSGENMPARPAQSKENRLAGPAETKKTGRPEVGKAKKIY